MTQSAASPTAPSPDNSLTGRLREVITGAKSSSPLQRITVVTPSYYSSFYLRRWLARNGLINVEFMRIEDLADLLAQDEINANEGRSLTRLEGAELVRQAVSECATSGQLSGPLSELASQPSFLTALQKSLGEIEAEKGTKRVSFERLSDPGEVTGAVGKIWDVYQRLKWDQRLFDRTQVSAWAVGALDSGALNTPAMQLSVGKLVVLAVAAPAAQYRSLWKALAGLPGSRTVTVATGDEKSDALLADLFDLGQGESESYDLPVPDAVSAADTRSEIAGLVQRIASAAANGVPFNHIAVLYGDPSYAARARSALSLANIPVSGPPQEPMIASPTGRFVSGVLLVISTELSRQEVGDWLATCPVKDPKSGKSISGIEWDRISKTARVTGGIDNWRRQLKHFASSRRFRAEQIEHHGEDAASSDGAVQTAIAFRNEEATATRLIEFIDQLSEDIKQPGETSSWSAWTDWLKQILDRYLHAPGNSSTSDSAERIVTLLDRIRDLDRLGSSQPDLTRFAAIVTRELSETRAGANNLGKGVFVANIRDAAATRFSHVHILGMADGTFPSPDTADPLLPDHVRNELNSQFGINLALSGVRKELRRRQFLTALMAGEAATLYWSRSSGPGIGQAGPAQWLIEQVRKQPGNEALQAGDLVAEPGRSSQPERVLGVITVDYGRGDEYSDSHEYTVASVRRHIDQQDPGDRHWLESDVASGIPLALSLERGRYGKSFTHWSGDLSSPAADVPTVSGEVLSASRIESFASCPLRYFFGYVLKVEPGVREDVSFHMAPDRRGTFIHAVLETYLNLRITETRPPGDAKTLDEAMSEVIEKWQREEPGAVGRVWELETTEIRRQLRRWLEKEKSLASSGSVPTDAELSFGRRSTTPAEQLLPAFEITLEDSTVLRFAGVIDRVERNPDGGYYVLDYKTGGPGSYTKLKDDPVDRGRHLQLALYSKAVQQFRSTDHENVAGYWFVMDGKQRIIPRPDEFDPAHAEQRLRDVLESLKQTSEDGHFPPNPGKPSFTRGSSSFENCGYCDFNRVCPASSRRERMLQAHSNDPRLTAYFDLALGDKRGAE